MPRILNLRGTSGSGKTHIVRRIMECYDSTPTIHRIPGRKQPIGYTYRRMYQTPLFVVGHYEGGDGGCGGCDNLSQGMDYIYSLIHLHAAQGEDVIFEGLIVASDWRRCVDLAKDHQVLVIGLDTPLPDCLASVQARRDARYAAKGEVAPKLDPKNTDAKFRALISQRKYFRDARDRPGSKLEFCVLDRNAALDAALSFFGLSRPVADPHRV